MKRRVTALVLALLIGCGPPPRRAMEPPRPQLAVREYQTRTYDTKDTAMVMKAVLNALQDEGFIIKNANDNLGLIMATKETENPDTPALLWLRTKLEWDKTFVLECSANVTEFGHETKVRANFEKKTINNLGAVAHVQQVEDAAYYQDFFGKVDKSVFIQRERL
jgi:hypothetical protein